MHKAVEMQAPRNLILAALPEDEMRVFRQSGKKIYLHAGKGLVQGDGRQDSVLFPTTAVISLLGVTQDGLSIETGMIGREGMVGMSRFLGQDTPPVVCIVQHGGEVCQMPAKVVRGTRLSSLERMLLRYSSHRIIELAQSAVCNKFHLARQRLCRWLLTSQDRTGLSEMEFTQEALAGLLGARRPVVASLLGALQDEHAIEYRRGSLSILDRRALEQCACECYDITASATARFMASLQ
jgi:hypothetical protein